MTISTDSAVGSAAPDISAPAYVFGPATNPTINRPDESGGHLQARAMSIRGS